MVLSGDGSKLSPGHELMKLRHSAALAELLHITLNNDDVLENTDH